MLPETFRHFYVEHTQPLILRPLRIAISLALLYLIFCSCYIWISGELAASSAGSVASLKMLELEKGLAFIVVTTIAFFLFSLLLLRRIVANTRQVLAQQKHLVHAERRAMAGVFAASVAHDINNILSVVELAAFRLRSNGEEAHARQDLGHTLEDANRRLAELTRRLMEVGHDSVSDEVRPTDMAALMRDSVEFVRRHRRVRDCEVALHADSGVVAHVSPHMISQMLLNLILNAAQATEGRGVIKVRLSEDGGFAVIEVHDNGPGIPEAQRGTVFDTFYTTHREGHGLGLLTVRACAEMHRGTVEVDDSPLGGACFRVRLPLRPQ